jgi:hypothetical protein
MDKRPRVAFRPGVAILENIHEETAPCGRGSVGMRNVGSFRRCWWQRMAPPHKHKVAGRPVYTCLDAKPADQFDQVADAFIQFLDRHELARFVRDRHVAWAEYDCFRRQSAEMRGFGAE